MNQPLDELYLNWLYDQVGNSKLRSPARTYWSLFRQLYTREFVWLVPNDDNRCADGKDLRLEFCAIYHLDLVDPRWMELGCSTLEMMVALSRKLAFEAEGEPREWFWQLISNLGLGRCTDAWYRVTLGEEHVEEVIDTLIFRTYSYEGDGGLFPLRNADRDQRQVEIWYQMNAYILEN